MNCDYIYNTRADSRGKIYARVEISSDTMPNPFPTTGEGIDGLDDSIIIDEGSLLQVLADDTTYTLGSGGQWHKSDGNKRPPASEYDRVWRENYEAPVDVYKNIKGYFSNFKMPDKNVIRVISSGDATATVRIRVSSGCKVHHAYSNNLGGTSGKVTSLITGENDIKLLGSHGVVIGGRAFDELKVDANVTIEGIYIYGAGMVHENAQNIEEFYANSPSARICMDEYNASNMSGLKSVGISAKSMLQYDGADSYTEGGTFSFFANLTTILSLDLAKKILYTSFFGGCEKLRGLPDLSGYKLSEESSGIFADCKSLKALPMFSQDAFSEVSILDNFCANDENLVALPFGPEVNIPYASSLYRAFSGTSVSLFPTFRLDAKNNIFDARKAFHVLGMIDFLEIVATPGSLEKIAASINPQDPGNPNDELASVMIYKDGGAVG